MVSREPQPSVYTRAGNYAPELLHSSTPTIPDYLTTTHLNCLDIYIVVIADLTRPYFYLLPCLILGL